MKIPHKTFLLLFLAFCICLPQGLIGQTQFLKMYGDADENIKGVTKVYNNAIFIFGRDDIGDPGRATISKYDLAGNLKWTLMLKDSTRIQDIIPGAVQGEYIFSGRTLPFSNSPECKSFIGKLTDNGLSYTLNDHRIFDLGNREFLNKLIDVSVGSNYAYAVSGPDTDSGSFDSMNIVRFDQNLDFLDRTVLGGTDLQSWSDFLLEANGNYSLFGNSTLGGTDGLIVTTNSALNAIVEAYQIPEATTIIDAHTDAANNAKLCSGTSLSGNGYICSYTAGGTINWFKEFDETTQIYSIDGPISSSATSSDYIAVGTTTHNGANWSMVFKFSVSNSNVFSLIWAKLLDDGSTSAIVGGVNIVAGSGPKKILYTDSRTNTTSGFGGNDFLIALLDNSLNSCMTVDTILTIIDGPLTTIDATSLIFINPGVLPSYTSHLEETPPMYSVVDPCGDLSCQTDYLSINTGYDPINDALYPTTSQDGFWILQNAPTNNGPVNLNSPAWNIAKHPAWASPPFNSAYISAFPVPGMNEANTNVSLAPYTFRKCFCVEDDNAQLDFNIDVHVDNQLQMYFYDPNGGIPRTHLGGTSGSSANNFKGVPEHINAAPIMIPTAGVYCLEAELRNDHHNSPMGLNISGWIAGASLLEDGCCSDTAYITGFKLRDVDCDGAVSISDPKVENFEIQLYDDIGAYVSSAFTDVNGYYTFAVAPGTYTVKEVLQSDWQFSVPPSGEYPGVLVDPNTVVQLNFGNIFTGPIVTDPISAVCISPGSNLDFTWIGQECNCDLQLQVRPCGSSEDYQSVADMDNTGSFSWTIPDYYSGGYQFQILDCDGFSIPFEGCVNVSEYSLELTAVQTDCGTYNFHATVNGIPVGDILSYQWAFDVIGSSTLAAPSFVFDDAGLYNIELTVVSNAGCEVSGSLLLDVAYGVNDPECDYCDPNIMSEVQGGDLFINDDCYGVVMQSPNGTCYRITVSDNGQITATAITCP